MILSDTDLRRALRIIPGMSRVQRPDLIIEPLDDPDVQIQPASVDLRLGPHITRFLRGFRVIDASEGMRDENLIVEDRAEAGYVTVRAGEFILGHTIERVRLPAFLTGRVEGRSSIGRLGVTMHVTAGYIDPGFDGQITLEIANLSARDVRIPIGYRVCQIVIETMSSRSAKPYGSPGRRSRFQGQSGSTPFIKRDMCDECGGLSVYDSVANTHGIVHIDPCPHMPPKGPSIANTSSA